MRAEPTHVPASKPSVATCSSSSASFYTPRKARATEHAPNIARVETEQDANLYFAPNLYFARVRRPHSRARAEQCEEGSQCSRDGFRHDPCDDVICPVYRRQPIDGAARIDRISGG